MSTAEARPNFTYAGVEVFRVSEEEAGGTPPTRLAIAARLAGLNGHALDEATAAFWAMLIVIEHEREIAETRRENLKLVSNE